MEAINLHGSQFYELCIDEKSISISIFHLAHACVLHYFVLALFKHELKMEINLNALLQREAGIGAQRRYSKVTILRNVYCEFHKMHTHTC